MRGYGKQLAEAIHSLHQAGYSHRDISLVNILVKEPKEGKPPYRIKLIDFGYARRIVPSNIGIKKDWKCFRTALLAMASKTKLKLYPNFKDLLKLLKSENFSSGEEILNHPFFAESPNESVSLPISRKIFNKSCYSPLA